VDHLEQSRSFVEQEAAQPEEEAWYAEAAAAGA
jgi:hypothetical protein